VEEPSSARRRLAAILSTAAVGFSRCAISDPKLFGYTTGQVFAANGGMYLD
jgi:hypothetical protein